MTENDQISLTTHFSCWFHANQDAMRLAALITEMAHVCDDLIDGDKLVSHETIARAFRTMLLEIPANPFYRANQGYLMPLLASVWLQWSSANVMEREKEKGDREKSYMLRAGLYSLYHGIAVLTGGLDWAEQVGPEIYRAYGETLESFDA